jgi:serine/threonine-protein kinase
MKVQSEHLNRGSIAEFLSGTLSAELESTVIRHLDNCVACQTELEAAAGEPCWWMEAKQFLSPDETKISPPWRGTDEDDDSNETTQLDFLTPSDDPAMLGRIGVYEVAGIVGRGGTGVVLKAFERSLNRYVAIKVLAPHLATSGAARKRFAREAQAAAAVVHEHIVPIHAVDEHQGLPYLVMRYVPGRSLQERLARRGPLELAEILRIGMQTAQGLAAAHAQGLVHRDVKPANILLENTVERVLLTNFGLARTVDDASLTCSGVIAGTPQYMAPEQARGEGIDHRTDLFSLGSVLYAMCVGHSPFRAETTMGVLHRICRETPRPLREMNPAMPEWLDRIIRRLHAKDPSKRYASAEEVAAVLGKRLAMVQTPGMSWLDPWWRRTAMRIEDAVRAAPRRVGAVAAALVVTTIVGATELIGITHFFQTHPTEQAVAAAHEASSPFEQTDTAASDLLAWNQINTETVQLRQAVAQLVEADRRPRTSEVDPWSAGAAHVWSRLTLLEQEMADPAEMAPSERPVEAEQETNQENER